MTSINIELVSVQPEELDTLVAIRIEAMQESLERVGRFDPVRARERFTQGFSAQNTRHIEVNGERVGFFVITRHDDAFSLDHLYIRPAAQGSGAGSAALRLLIEDAQAAGLPIKVGALKESASNRFYMRHGFVFVESGEFDNYYIRPSASGSRSG